MNDDFISKVKHNAPWKVIAVFYFLIAAICLIYNYFKYSEEQVYYPKLLFLGVLCIVMGFIVLFFRGSTRPIIEYPFEKLSLRIFWQESSKIDRAAWIIGLILSVIIYVKLDHFLEYGY